MLGSVMLRLCLRRWLHLELAEVFRGLEYLISNSMNFSNPAVYHSMPIW